VKRLYDRNVEVFPTIDDDDLVIKEAAEMLSDHIWRPSRTWMLPGANSDLENDPELHEYFQAMSGRLLDRFAWFRWLRTHPKARQASGGGGVVLSLWIAKQALDYEIDGASKTAAAVFLAAWAVLAFAIYVSNMWDKRRQLMSAVLVITGVLLWVIWWAYLPLQSEVLTAPSATQSTPSSPPSPAVSGTAVPQSATGFLQFDSIEIAREYSYIVAGKQFGGNFYSRNPGPTRVFNAFGYSKAYVINSRPGGGTDLEIDRHFEQDLAPVRHSYLRGDIKGPEQGIGQGIWTTVLTPTLSQEDVEGIIRGTSTIYFVTWLAWSDQQGNKDSAYDCRYLQGWTLSAQYKKEHIVWHFCQHFSGRR
jgi:hypothetical protein